MHVRNTVNINVNLLLRLWGIKVIICSFDTNVRLIYRCDLISDLTTIFTKYSREKGAT